MFEHVSLNGTNFDRADLDDAIFRHCDLSSANLAGARLRRASFAFTEFRYARMEGCNLRRSTLTSCLLEEASVQRGALDGANIVACRCDYADFSDASFFQTNTLHSVFTGATFTGSKQFAWSREIVVELLARHATDLELIKYVGAIALNRRLCYDEWRTVLKDHPEYRRLALEALEEYDASGFRAAMGGLTPEPPAEA